MQLVVCDAACEAYAALGMELTWERNFSAAEVAFQKAISLDPDYAKGDADSASPRSIVPPLAGVFVGIAKRSRLLSSCVRLLPATESYA